MVPINSDAGISPYLLSLDQYSELVDNYTNIFDNLGLHDLSFFSAYEAQLVTVKEGNVPLSLSSEIAPVSSDQYGIRMEGFNQTIIPNTNALQTEYSLGIFSRVR